MSLDDLEIRKHTAPISAELDRQKEKCAAAKKEAKVKEALESLVSQVEDWHCANCSQLTHAMSGRLEKEQNAVIQAATAALALLGGERT